MRWDDAVSACELPMKIETREVQTIVTVKRQLGVRAIGSASGSSLQSSQGGARQRADRHCSESSEAEAGIISSE
jgi:hypothetical protein